MARAPYNILITESGRMSRAAIAALGRVGRPILADLDRAALLAAVEDVDILWVRLRHRIDAEVLDAAPRLRVIWPDAGSAATAG